MAKNKVYLKDIDWPSFGEAAPIIFPSTVELMERITKCRLFMEERGLTHIVVYGDREHFSNLMYLTHFDPRFEEALLIITKEENPLILVGNECVSHLTVSSLYNSGLLRYERYQPFSLLNQPRNESRSLTNILIEEGIKKESKIGCIGWKYYSELEFKQSQYIIEIPSFIVDTLRSLSSYENVVNVTDILMSPSYGLKSSISSFEIAHFEFVNVMASEGMKKLITNFKSGITDFELVKEYQFTGYPLGCHVSMKGKDNQNIGLSSPIGTMIEKGMPFSTGISYWGSNIYRAGWVAENENDLPEDAKDYVLNFAAPYFYACAKWLENLKIGTKGDFLRKLIDEYLPFDDFGVFLNPGHLIHYEEWLSSPIYLDSEEEIHSGMYMQVDIIPRSNKYSTSRMEDGIVIADRNLRNHLKEEYPEIYGRCMKRRSFVIDVLGINLPEEILPLSNIPSIIPPYFLNHKKVLSLKP
ncbi:MAG: hypothetical protein PHI32_06000 [Dysgonamonadaceae bacterium]|nr:hypothetical protein [Dysgonamonadaceae bacterium]MDD4729123.1 hypothetical protein [Dysgonamonadaceae bacterium]